MIAESFVSSDNANIYVRSNAGGGGTPLVIVNNFFMTADHWGQFTGKIAANRSVINYDLRHQGKSSRVDIPLSIEQHVNDLLNVINHLRLGRVILLGTCISTLICKEFIRRFPEKVSGAIFVGPIFDPFGGLRRYYMHKALLASLKAGGAQGLFDHYYPLLYNSKKIEMNRRIGYQVMRSAFLETNTPDQLAAHLASTLAISDSPKEIAEVTCPTLFLCGSDDFLTSETALRAMVGMMPDAKYKIIEDSAHNPYIDATEAFEDHVVQFASAFP